MASGEGSCGLIPFCAFYTESLRRSLMLDGQSFQGPLPLTFSTALLVLCIFYFGPLAWMENLEDLMCQTSFCSVLKCHLLCSKISRYLWGKFTPLEFVSISVNESDITV